MFQFRSLACGLLGLLVWPGLEVSATENLRAPASAAWGGYARPGSWTEITLRVVAADGGPLEVETRGGDVRVIWRGTVEAGVERLLVLPAYVGAAGVLRVNARGPEGSKRSTGLDLHPLGPGERLVAWVSARPSRGWPREWPSGVRRVHVRPEHVAVSPRAFEQLDALVVEAAAMVQLEPAARRAIDRHLGACRRLLAVGLAPPAARRWRGHAGCDAAGFAAVDDADQVAAALANLLAVELPRLPGSAELRELSPQAGPTARAPLIAFFAGYGVVLLLSALALRRAWLLGLVPLGAAALLLASFGQSRPGVQLVAWTEATSGSDAASFAALVRVDGLASGHTALELPGELGPPDLHPAHGKLVMGETSADAPTLWVRTALLSEQRLYLQGTVAWTAPLRLARTSEGPRVSNPGPDGSTSAWLFWDANVYRVPPLDPHGHWTPSGVKPSAPASLPRPLVARARAAKRALVLRDSPPLLPRLGELTATEWTLIHPGAAE